MIEALLAHALCEYIIQPEWVIANKRTVTPLGAVAMAVHAAPPAMFCGWMGWMTPLQTAVVVSVHFLLDGYLGAKLVSLLPIQSVSRAMTNPDHEKWPIQVQALEFALAAAHEKATWATVHALFLVLVMKYVP